MTKVSAIIYFVRVFLRQSEGLTATRCMATFESCQLYRKTTKANTMKHISILVPQGAILGSIEGPRQVFTEVNKFLVQLGKPPLFRIQLVGLSPEVKAHNGIYIINTDTLIQHVKETKLIIIPALDGDMVKTLEGNKDFIPWVVEQYKKALKLQVCV